MQPSDRMLPAVAVALVTGVLRALQAIAPQLLLTSGLTAGRLSLVLTVGNLLVLAASPFGAAVAGYVWGAGADVPRNWRSLAAATFVAAAVGFLATYLLGTAVLVLGEGSPALVEAAVRSLYHIVTVAGLAGVSLAALAGAAVAQFRALPADRPDRHLVE